MSVANAKARLDKGAGEPDDGYITASDIQDGYDDLESAWTTDIASNLGVGITGTPNGAKVGSPGDIVRQTDSLHGITYWIKESGDGTVDGWVIRDSTPALGGVDYQNLTKWRAALQAARNEPDTTANLLWLGTSNPYGEGATDMETNGAPFALALNMDAALGSTVKYLEPTNSRSLEGTWSRSYMSMGSGWSVHSDTLIADKGGIKGDPGGTGAFTYTHPDCEMFTVLARDWINTFDLTVDGGTAVPQTGTDSGPAIMFNIDAGARGPHTLTIDNVQGADDLRVCAVGGGLRSGVNVSNFGVSGTHSDNWVKDGSSDWASMSVTFDALQPDLTIITLGGGNEITGGVTPAEYLANLGTLISRAQLTGDVILNGPCWTFDTVANDIDEYHEAAREAAWLSNVPYLDVVKVLGGDPEKYETGGHFNADAHRIWARATQRAVLGL